MIGCADVDAADVYAVAAAVYAADVVDFVDVADDGAGAGAALDAIARDGVIARASRVVRDNPLTRAS